MTVNVTDITSGPYAGNDVADTFSYDFTVKIKTQLSVFQTSPSGVVTTMVLDSDYTVTGVGVSGGGTVVRTAGPLPTGYQWFIVSNYKLSQLTDFESQGAFYPDVHEASFDKLTYLLLQTARATGLSLHLPDSYSGNASTELPLPSANSFLRWKADLTGLENVNLDSGASASQGNISDYLNDTLTNFGEAVVAASTAHSIVNFQGLTLTTDDQIVIPSNASCRKWVLNGANLTFTSSSIKFQQPMYEIDGVGGTITGGLKLAQISEASGTNTKVLKVFQGHDFIVGDYMNSSLDIYNLPNSESRLGYTVKGDYNRIQSIVDNGDGTDTVTLTYNFLVPPADLTPDYPAQGYTVSTGLVKNAWVANSTFSSRGLDFQAGGNVTIKDCVIDKFQGYHWNIDDGALELRQSVMTLQNVEFPNSFIDLFRFRGLGIIHDHVKVGRTYDFSKQNLVCDIPHDRGFVVYKNGCNFARQNRDGEIFPTQFEVGQAYAELGNVFVDNTCTFNGTAPADLVKSNFAPSQTVTGSFSGSVLTLTPVAFYIGVGEAFKVTGSVSNDGSYVVVSKVQALDGKISSITVEETFVTESSGSFDIAGKVYWGINVAIGDAIHFCVPNKPEVKIGSGEIGASSFLGYERSLFGTSFNTKTSYQQGKWSFVGTKMECEPFYISVSPADNTQTIVQKYIIFTTNCDIKSRGLNSYNGGCYHYDIGSTIELTPENRVTPLIAGSTNFSFVHKTGGSLSGRYVINTMETTLKDVRVLYTDSLEDVLIYKAGVVSNPNDNHLILMPPLDDDFNSTGDTLKNYFAVLPISKWFASNATTTSPAPPPVNFRIFEGSQAYSYGGVGGFSVPYAKTTILPRNIDVPFPTAGKYSGVYSVGDLFTNLATKKNLRVNSSERFTALTAGTAAATTTVQLSSAPTATTTFRWVGIWSSQFKTFNYLAVQSVVGDVVTFTTPTLYSWSIADEVCLISVSPEVDNRDAPNTQTGTTYSLKTTDVNRTVRMTNAAANVVAIGNDAFQSMDTDSTIMIVQLGVGATTIDADPTVTLNGVLSGSCTISGQYQGATLVKLSADTWMVTGAISVVA